MNLTNQKILISGGGRGIGFAVAKSLYALGNELFICGRNEETLYYAAKKMPGTKYFICDVANEKQIKDLADVVRKEFGDITMLINNAGIATFFDINRGGAYANARREIETNYLGLIHMTETFLPVLKRQQEAAIVNISSASAIVPHKWIPTYSASKAAVQMFGASLRLALKDSTVKVFNILPPLVDTDFAEAQSTKKISAEKVAAALVKGLQKDNYEIHVADVKALRIIHRLVPSWAQSIMNNRIEMPRPNTVYHKYRTQEASTI